MSGASSYDWARLAARYFPARVRAKCVEDPSLGVAHHCFWELHPAKAYAWELRLKDEIKPEFTIDEPGSDKARARFLKEHPGDARAIEHSEQKRRERKAAKADDDSDGPLFEQGEEESDGEAKGERETRKGGGAKAEKAGKGKAEAPAPKTPKSKAKPEAGKPPKRGAGRKARGDAGGRMSLGADGGGWLRFAASCTSLTKRYWPLSTGPARTSR